MSSAKMNTSATEFDQVEVQAVSIPPTTDDETHFDSIEAGGVEATTTTPTQGKLFDGKAAEMLVYENGGYPLLVLMCSVVTIIASSVNCSQSSNCTGKNGWAVAASVISFVVSIVYLFLDKRGGLDPKILLIITVFLFCWWIAFTGVATFAAPFVTLQNGYFACWGGLLATGVMVVNSIGKIKESLVKFSQYGYKLIFGLVGSAVVLVAGAVKDCGSFSPFVNTTGYCNYAIAAGAISFVLFLVRIIFTDKFQDNIGRYFALFMILWWTVGMIILTFVNPFKFAGNGYFGTWVCFICSLLLLDI